VGANRLGSRVVSSGIPVNTGDLFGGGGAELSANMWLGSADNIVLFVGERVRGVWRGGSELPRDCSRA